MSSFTISSIIFSNYGDSWINILSSLKKNNHTFIRNVQFLVNFYNVKIYGFSYTLLSL
jgi:phage-related protein